jgi:phenol hydroxylase P5 protein
MYACVFYQPPVSLITMSQLFQARVSEHTLLSKDYHWFTIDLVSPTSLDFQAGQFVLLNIPGVPAKKAYSIPSSPASKGQINLLIDVSPQGDGTLYMQSLKPGDPISFLAPAGQFTLSSDPAEQKITLIATGSGISAVRSMALWLLQTQRDQRPINLHWGMRFIEDAFWEEEFRLLEKENSNFHFDLVLSKPPEGWPLCGGHINDCLTNHYSDFSNTGYYMCGNPKMIEGIVELLTQKGVSSTLIHHERFG